MHQLFPVWNRNRVSRPMYSRCTSTWYFRGVCGKWQSMFHRNSYGIFLEFIFSIFFLKKSWFFHLKFFFPKKFHGNFFGKKKIPNIFSRNSLEIPKIPMGKNGIPINFQFSIFSKKIPMGISIFQLEIFFSHTEIPNFLIFFLRNSHFSNPIFPKIPWEKKLSKIFPMGIPQKFHRNFFYGKKLQKFYSYKIWLFSCFASTILCFSTRWKIPIGIPKKAFFFSQISKILFQLEIFWNFFFPTIFQFYQFPSLNYYIQTTFKNISKNFLIHFQKISHRFPKKFQKLSQKLRLNFSNEFEKIPRHSLKISWIFLKKRLKKFR